ncbi:MAG: cytochrome P450, partial [Sphingomonadales bacterium]
MALAEAIRVPDHVPAHLVWDHDIDSFPAQFADPYVGMSEAIHSGPEIVWAARGAYCGQPGWMLTRFAQIQEVHLDPARFSAALNRDASNLLGIELPLIPGESDPPRHRHYRQLIAPWFQPSAIAALDVKIRATCDDLIGRFAEQRRCEFVGEFSSLFPSYVFLALFGLPRELLSQFLGWENSFLRGQTMEERIGAMRAIYDYFKGCLEERARAPREDMITAIATGEVEGRRLSEAEAVGTCITLYIGGLDSVASGLGWYLRHLARDQALQDRLRRDPTLIPAAIEELSRAYGTNSTKRTVMADFDFHGAPMRKGDILAMPTFLSARDPREYDDPHVVDIGRKARSMTFGSGVHHCVGIHLAKREIRIVLSEFLSRFDT